MDEARLVIIQICFWAVMLYLLAGTFLYDEPIGWLVDKVKWLIDKVKRNNASKDRS